MHYKGMKASLSGHCFNFCCDPSGRIFRFWVANFSRVTRQKRERECSENGHGSLTNIKVAALLWWPIHSHIKSGETKTTHVSVGYKENRVCGPLLQKPKKYTHHTL